MLPYGIMRITSLMMLAALGVSPAVAVAGVAASDGTKPIDLFDDVVFATDSAALSDVEAPHADTAALWMKRHPNMRIVLEGHADKTGRATYNEDLATRRLERVRDRLHADGVAMDRMVLVVYGEADAEQDRVNPIDRRVELYATTDRAPTIAKAQLDRTAALEVVWTDRGMLFSEHNGANHRHTEWTAKR
jgi:hypothetical protein